MCAMSVENVGRLDDFARERHPAWLASMILTCEPDEVIGRLDVKHELVAGTGFLGAPDVIALADWLCVAGIGHRRRPAPVRRR